MQDQFWAGPTSRVKKTLEDALDKHYWGTVNVSEAIQKKCLEDEAFRDFVRRSVASLGKELWNMNKRRRDMIESKHENVFNHDQEVRRSTPYLKSFRLRKGSDIVIKIEGNYKEQMNLDFGADDFHGYIGSLEFIKGS